MIIRILSIIILSFILFFSGCGGGGVSSVIPDQPTTNPNQSTPTPTPTPTNTIAPTFTPTPVIATGQITDILTRQAITNCQISVDGLSFTPDNLGNFNHTISSANEHWYNIIVSGPEIITREFYSQNLDNLAIKTINSNYNDTMFRAYQRITSNGTTVYFNPADFPVKLVLYQKTDQGNPVDSKSWDLILANANEYKENCFPAEIEIYPNTPITDSRFQPVYVEQTNSYYGYCFDSNAATIACVVCENYRNLTGYDGGGACSFDDNNIIQAGAVTIDTYQNIWDNRPEITQESKMDEQYYFILGHEYGHACGFEHPDENMATNQWAENLEKSIMNFIDLNQRSEILTQTDLDTFTILNDRGGNNQAPDFNPIPEITSSQVSHTKFQH